MSAIIGERDTLIRNTVPRYSAPVDRALLLTASATMFEVSVAGAPTPEAITFSALMLGAEGDISFSSDPSVPLTVANGNAVLKYADMNVGIVTISASTVIDGLTYYARQTVAKQQALDFRPPPAPTGLAATGTPSTVVLRWNAPPANYNNLSHTEIWRAAVNDFSKAALVGRADGREYTDPVGPGAFRYYWIRYISHTSIPGPYNNSTGTMGSSDAEVEHLLQVLTAQIGGLQLDNTLSRKYGVQVDSDGVAGGFEFLAGGGQINFGVRASTFFIAAPLGSDVPSAIPFIVRTTETVVGGVTIPIGVYIADAFIQNASITNAKIGGDIWSSNYVAGQAGWRLNRAGNLEVNNLQARGYIAGGAMQSWAWAGGPGFYLGPEGLRLGREANGQFFEVTASGALRAPGLTIGNGKAEFKGSVAVGQTAFNTGVGFWAGIDADGVPKMSLGEPGGPGIRWDGTNLYVINPIIHTFTLAITASSSGTYFTLPRNVVGGFAGSYTAKATEGSGYYSYLWRLERSVPTSVSASNYTNAQVNPVVSGGGFVGEIDFIAICTCTDNRNGQTQTKTLVFTVNFT